MKLLDAQNVLGKTTLGKSTMYVLIKEGKFPAPIKIGERAVGWLESEIDEWIEGRVKASRDVEKAVV